MLEMPRIQPKGWKDMSPKKGSDRHKVTQQSEAEQAQLLTSGQELSPTGRSLSLCCSAQKGLPGEPA